MKSDGGLMGSDVGWWKLMGGNGVGMRVCGGWVWLN